MTAPYFLNRAKSLSIFTLILGESVRSESGKIEFRAGHVESYEQPALDSNVKALVPIRFHGHKANLLKEK